MCVKGTGGTLNAEIIVYLNRLSDLLWLFARWVETERHQPKLRLCYAIQLRYEPVTID